MAEQNQTQEQQQQITVEERTQQIVAMRIAETILQAARFQAEAEAGAGYAKQAQQHIALVEAKAAELEQRVQEQQTQLEELEKKHATELFEALHGSEGSSNVVESGQA